MVGFFCIYGGCMTNGLVITERPAGARLNKNSCVRIWKIEKPPIIGALVQNNYSKDFLELQSIREKCYQAFKYQKHYVRPQYNLFFGVNNSNLISFQKVFKALNGYNFYLKLFSQNLLQHTMEENMILMLVLCPLSIPSLILAYRLVYIQNFSLLITTSKRRK